MRRFGICSRTGSATKARLVFGTCCFGSFRAQVCPSPGLDGERLAHLRLRLDHSHARALPILASRRNHLLLFYRLSICGCCTQLCARPPAYSTDCRDVREPLQLACWYGALLGLLANVNAHCSIIAAPL